MKNCRKWCRTEWICALGLVVLTALGISFLGGRYTFAGNDDLMLRSIVSGNYTGKPEAHLIYIMYPLGWILKTLYQLLPTVGWYDVFMVGMHYLCLFLLLYRLGQQFEKTVAQIVSMILGLGVILILDLPHIMVHQYTVLAGLLATTAVFWLATSRNDSRVGSIGDKVMVIIFLTLCLWLRKQVFLMALPIVCILLVKQFAELWKEEAERRRWKDMALFAGILLSIVLVSYGMEFLAYKDVAWQKYEVYNEARTDIYDFYGLAPYEKYQDAYTSMGISYGDWLALYRYDGGLLQDLDENVLEELAQWAKQEWEAPRQYYSVWRKAIYIACEIFFFQDVQPVGILLTVIYVLYLLYCYKRDDKAGMICACGMLFFQIAFVVYFAMLGRLVERVSYGLYMMQVFALIGWMFRLPAGEKAVVRKDKFWVFSGGALLCVLFAMTGLYRVRFSLDALKALEAPSVEWDAVNAYCSEHSQDTYCIVTDSFATAVEDMFTETPKESANLVRLGSWIQYSPLEMTRKEGQGIHNLTEQLAEEENFYIIQSAETNLEWLYTFWQEKGYEVSATVTDTIMASNGRAFHVIRMQ